MLRVDNLAAANGLSMRTPSKPTCQRDFTTNRSPVDTTLYFEDYTKPNLLARRLCGAEVGNDMCSVFPVYFFISFNHTFGGLVTVR